MERRKQERWFLSTYEHCGSSWALSSRCKDSHTTYFPGISTADDTWTKEELEAIGQNAKEEARQQYAERQEKRFSRLEKNSLDEENQKRYAARRVEWKMQKENGDIFRQAEHLRTLAEMMEIIVGQLRLQEQFCGLQLLTVELL